MLSLNPLEASSSILLSTCLLVLTTLAWWYRRPHLKLPPGPPALPIIGNLHQLKKLSFQTYDALFKQYGDLFYFRLGQVPTVVVSSYDLLKSSLAQPVFSGRFRPSFHERFHRDSGVVFLDGEKWHFHRRLSLQILRDFGMGKSISESIVRQEAVDLCQHLDEVMERKNGLLETSSIFSCTTLNIISQFTLGERPGYHNKEFSQFMDDVHFSTNNSDFVVALPVLFPRLNVIAPLLGLNSLTAIINNIHNFVLKKLAAHRERTTTNEIEQPGNYVDAYYLAKEQHAKKMGTESANKYFNEWQFVRLVLELYVGGMDTSATTLCWATLLLSLHDSVRQRMSDEIHHIIGKERVVTMQDRKLFQYSLAVIDEIMRVSSIAPYSLFHRALEDTKLGGYDIPKDTVIIPNLYSLHHDPRVWERPNEFYPQHFLSEDGTTYRPREHLIPFGIGKRSCLGESLARIEIFIFIVTLVQRYRFRVELDEKNGETLEKCLDGTGGLIRATGPHKIHFTKL